MVRLFHVLLPTMYIGVSFVTAVTTAPAKVALAAAGFVLDNLKEISDSGIYGESLQLRSVHNAEVVDGLFHACIVLDAELSSSYFASGNETEMFEMIVMRRTQERPEDPKRWHSYAIDRFPKMKNDAIKNALQRKVEMTVRRNEKIRREILS